MMSSPIFEGSEKRLEVDFLLSQGTPGKGLRCLSRQQLDILLDKARLFILSCNLSSTKMATSSIY